MPGSRRLARMDLPGPLGPRLTPREHQVVRLVAEGRRSKDVASLLGITVKTVDTHRANLMRKLNIHSVRELVRFAIRMNLVQS
jgi:DNA-binding CsgD family transcriptional regulator